MKWIWAKGRIFYEMSWLNWEKQKAWRPMSSSGWMCLLFPVQSVVLIGNATVPFLSLLNLPAPLALSQTTVTEILCHHSGGMKCCIFKPFFRSLFLDLQHFSCTVLKSFSWLCKSWDTVWLYQLSADQGVLRGKWWVTACLSGRLEASDSQALERQLWNRSTGLWFVCALPIYSWGHLISLLIFVIST